MEKRNSPSSNLKNNNILKYLALGTEMLVSIGAGLFLGYKADHWLHIFPLLSIALPLLILVGFFYKLIRETGNTKKNGPK